MKKSLIGLILSLVSLSAFAQNNCDIGIGVYFGDETSEMTTQNRTFLRNVVTRAASQGNTISDLEDSQFGIVVKTDIVDQYIITGAPAKTVLNLNMTLYVGDVHNGKLFSSQAFSLNGVGNSKEKAYNNAIRKLNPQNKVLVTFVSKAKDEVLDYYNKNYMNIIKQAQTAAALRNYEEALYKLMCIPVCCSGYNAAMKEAIVVYRQYVDRQCEENLAQAQAAWISGFTAENAAVASIFLSEIYPDAACYKEAMKLVAEIKRHMGEEWKFKMKQWDGIVNIESQRLKYAREIALAYAQNQPQQIIHLLYR